MVKKEERREKMMMGVSLYEESKLRLNKNRRQRVTRADRGDGGIGKDSKGKRRDQGTHAKRWREQGKDKAG